MGRVPPVALAGIIAVLVVVGAIVIGILAGPPSPASCTTTSTAGATTSPSACSTPTPTSS